MRKAAGVSMLLNGSISMELYLNGTRSRRRVDRDLFEGMQAGI
jgi:hypothetical protein